MDWDIFCLIAVKLQPSRTVSIACHPERVKRVEGSPTMTREIPPLAFQARSGWQW